MKKVISQEEEFKPIVTEMFNAALYKTHICDNEEVPYDIIIENGNIRYLGAKTIRQ